MTLNHVPCPGHNGPSVKGLPFSYAIHSLNENIGRFCIQILRPLSFFYFTAFSNSHVTLHAHSHICKSTSTLDLDDNDSAIATYDFENPIYQAEDEVRKIVKYLEILQDC